MTNWEEIKTKRPFRLKIRINETDLRDAFSELEWYLKEQYGIQEGESVWRVVSYNPDYVLIHVEESK